MTRQRRLTSVLATILVAFLGSVAWAADTDLDGLSDAFEDAYGTDKYAANSDIDGWDDYEEIFTYGTDPLLTDTDGDGTADDLDTTPLYYEFVGSEPDGSSTVTHATLPSTTLWAASGESAQDGNGVYVHNGCFVYRAGVGRAQGVKLPFGFWMKYISQLDYNGFQGMNWVSMLDMQLVESGSDLIVTTPDFRYVTFVGNGSGWNTPDPDRGTMTDPNPGEYLWTMPEGDSLLFVGGRLEKIEDPYGNSTTLTWSGGKATKATDSRGLDHTFAYYSGTDRLKSITMDDGRVWTFEYNDCDQLARIVGPVTTSFPDGITWEFRYTNGSTIDANLNHNMVAAIDGKGQSWLRMTYDSSDRVDTQTIGGGTWAFDYSDAANDKTTVTDGVGAQRVWEWDATKLTRKKLEEKSNLDVRATDPTSWDTAWTHDSDGYLLTVTYPEGNGVKYTLNSAKRPTERRHKSSMTAADSNTNDLVHKWTYDSTKNYGVTKYTNPEGEEWNYTVNSDGQRTQTTHPTLTGETSGFTESWAYNADGTIDTYTDAEGVVTEYTYYTTPTDLLGRVQKVTVDEGTGLLNLATQYDYTDWGQVNEITDPEGNVTTLTVEAYGNVTKIAAPTSLGYETLQTFDANLNVTQRSVKNIDENGTALTSPAWWDTDYTFNTMDQALSVTETISATETRMTEFTYDSNQRRDSKLLDGRTWEWSYDERGLLHERTRVLDLSGGGSSDITESFDYDLNGNLDEYTDARSKVTEFEWDGFDRRTKTINALDDYEQTIYDKNGQVTERKLYDAGTTDVLMAHHKRSYDEMARLIKVEDAILGTTTTWVDVEYTLDKNGLVTGIEDARANDTTIAWDNARRRTSVLDALGNEVEYEYDDNGNVTAIDEIEIIPGSASTHTFRTEFDYDVINRRTKQTVIDRTLSTNKKITQWKYNSRNVVAKVIDPMNVTTTNTHDGLGRKTQESVDMGSSAAIVTQWAWDDNDNMTLLTDDNGNQTEYEFDTLNRLVEKTYEDATTATYSYDAAGNVTEMFDRAGNDIDMAYDDVNQMTDRDATLVTGFGGDTTEDFTYDAMGRLLQAKDNDSIVEFTYDSLSRVLTETQGPNPLGTSGKTVDYSYDANGNTTQIDYPSGFEAHRTFDVLNRLTLVEDKSAVDIADWDLYGAARRRDIVTFGNGTTATYDYDGFRRPTEISHETSTPTQFAGFEYGWDKNDNPLYEERSHQSGKGDVYSYDNANRLTTVLQDVDDPAAEVASPGTEAYVDKVDYNMDDVLNFTSLVTTPYGGSASTVSYTTNAMNEYTAVGGVTHTYDDNGNLIDDGVNEYVFNWKNQLIEVIDGTSQSTVAEYAYDCYGLGRRFEKAVGTDTTRFIYADQQCIEEYDGSDDLLRLFVFGTGLDEVVMMEAPDVADVDSDQNTTELKRFYYHTQLIGSVTHVTDPDEVVVESYDYGPYGEIAMFDIGSSSISASAIGNPFTYTGRRLDEESGLYYYRARHYSSELKRFVQRDPLEYVDGPNAYGYAHSSPLARTDPTGLDDKKDAKDAKQKQKEYQGKEVTYKPGENEEETKENIDEAVQNAELFGVLSPEEIDALKIAAAALKRTLGRYKGMTHSHGLRMTRFGRYYVFTIVTVCIYPEGDEETKKHEQIHNHINEAAADKANETGEGKDGDDPPKVSGSAGGKKADEERDAALKSGEEQRRENQEEYDDETQHGKNGSSQGEWNERYGK